MRKLLRYFLLFFLLSAFVVSFSFLNSCNNATRDNLKTYASLSDTVKYTGIQSCRECHADKYDTYVHTGMGMSLDLASRQKSAARFSNNEVVKDTFLDLNYFPFWEHDSLKVLEFRKENNDTVYNRLETIHWIVGSGQHTNSHLLNSNGYIYQAPVTFYTQSRKWDLPPGFEGGYNSRFSRKIGLECMSCHNAYPEMVLGSENKYSIIPNGIDCERCHGPGSAHINAMREGKLTDVAKEIDYTIVNPAKLPINLQLDICQRCHIQGNAVLNQGKSFFDFKPGMQLSDVMNVFMPNYIGDESTHIMASHAERMKKSRCFIVSEKNADKRNKENPTVTPYKNALTCVTCHDPHVSVTQTGDATFNTKCKSCHTLVSSSNSKVLSSTICKESEKVRSLQGDNCVKCHMPKSGTIDIPHVTATDHWIRVPLKKEEVRKIKEFAGLVCINNSSVGEKTKGEAFLSYYEKFSNNPAFLDSAKRYFSDSNKDSIQSNFNFLIRWAFLKNDFPRVIYFTEILPDALASLTKKNYSNEHAWTAYRIGESYSTLGNINRAINFYERSVELAPYVPDFRNKLAGVYVDARRLDEARKNYTILIKENPEFTSPYVSLGYLVLTMDNDEKLAEYYYRKALSLDPDQIQALLNMAGLKLYQGKKKEAKFFIQEVLKRQKDNKQANLLLKGII